MLDLAAWYHDRLDAGERINRPAVCPDCGGTGRTKADRGWVACRWCTPYDVLDRERERELRARLYGENKEGER